LHVTGNRVSTNLTCGDISVKGSKREIWF